MLLRTSGSTAAPTSEEILVFVKASSVTLLKAIGSSRGRFGRNASSLNFYSKGKVFYSATAVASDLYPD